MIELRKAEKDEALREVKLPKSAHCGEAFSKLQKIFTLLVTEHWVRFSETIYIYNTIHLLTTNHENQSDSLDARMKRLMSIGHLHITFPFNAIPHLAMCELLRAG
jgi:hypothetical protein